MAAYASINKVYKRLQVLLNKQQLGFITPSQFDEIAEQAQQEIFNDTLEELTKHLKYKLRGLETARGDIKATLEDNIRTLLVYNEPLIATSNNIFAYPDRYAHWVSIIEGDNTVAAVDPEDSQYYINNRYSPRSGWSVAICGSNQIEMIPDTITSGVKMSYYKFPMGSRSGVPLNSPPSWAYTKVGEDLLYNPSTSVDFELPKHMEERIVDSMLSLMGLSLRDKEAMAYGELQEQKEQKD